MATMCGIALNLVPLRTVSFFTPLRGGSRIEDFANKYFENLTHAHYAHVVKNYDVYSATYNVVRTSDGQRVTVIEKNKDTQCNVLYAMARTISFLTILIPVILLAIKYYYRCSSEVVAVKPIDIDFRKASAEKQREAHSDAKDELRKMLPGASISFVHPKPAAEHSPFKAWGETYSADALLDKEADKVRDMNKLGVFSWEETTGVQDAIHEAKRDKENIYLFGVASQFNGAEATDRFTPLPFHAKNLYETDRTQGPGAQLQFPDAQIEAINIAANQGLNGLVNVVPEGGHHNIRHGYLTPETGHDAEIIANEIQTYPERMEIPVIGSVPRQTDHHQVEGAQPVYQMLVSAPAYGEYSHAITQGSRTIKNRSDIFTEDHHLQYQCALHAYRAQFQQAIELKKGSGTKNVIAMLTAPGLGVFRNNPKFIALAFLHAADEYGQELKANNIKVRLQVFRPQNPLEGAMEMANFLALEKYQREE